MARIHPAYLEHERKRFMRPDAHRFLRPDWRRFVRPDSELAHHYAELEAKYRPDQPRVPAGQREGGQWTDDEQGESEIPDGAKPIQYKPDNQTTELSAASRGKGHHYVPRSEFNKRNISEDARKVFEKKTTGPLLEVRSNKWNKDHATYNAAVGEALDEYLRNIGTPPEKMTADQAHEFVRRIKESSDPRIRDYNFGIHIREIMQRLLRRGGRE